MKYTILNKEGLIYLIDGLLWVTLLSFLTSCASLSCGGKVGKEYDECKLKEAHQQMVRSGFYESGGINK